MISTAIKCATPPTTQHVAVMWTSYFGTRHKHQRQSLAPKNGLGDWWNTLSSPPFAHSDKIPFIVGVVVVFFMWKTTPCFKMSALCVQEPWLSSLLSLLSFTHTHHKHYTQLLSHIFSFIHFIFLSYTLLSPSLCNVSSFPRVYLLFERVELSDWLHAIYLMSRWDYPPFCRENQGAKMRMKCNEPVMCGKHYSSLISHLSSQTL